MKSERMKIIIGIKSFVRLFESSMKAACKPPQLSEKNGVVVSLSWETQNDKSIECEKKKPKTQRETLPLAFIGCGKNVVAQNPFHHVTETAENGIFLPRITVSYLTDGSSGLITTLNEDRLLLISLVSLNHVWVILSSRLFFSSSCVIKKASCIVPAHCFAVLTLLSSGFASRHHCRSKVREKGTRILNIEHKKQEKKTFVCTIDKGLLLIVCVVSSSSSNTINTHLFQSRFFFLSYQEKKIFVSFINS